ncbi:hypothetical protein RIF29_19244 [Crotalaria pallida]|uniref:Uncharacterized protein n=1 Tax=Crotalaria pallida TaxID=3830 RepID=A0AAN9F3I4_CROPI
MHVICSLDHMKLIEKEMANVMMNKGREFNKTVLKFFPPKESLLLKLFNPIACYQIKVEMVVLRSNQSFISIAN